MLSPSLDGLVLRTLGVNLWNSTVLKVKGGEEKSNLISDVTALLSQKHNVFRDSNEEEGKI